MLARTLAPPCPPFEEDYFSSWPVLEKLWTPLPRHFAPQCISVSLDTDVGIQCLISLGSDPQGSTSPLQESTSRVLVP